MMWTNRGWLWISASVGIVVLSSALPVSAQIRQTSYDSLTAIAGSNPNQVDVTANIISLTGHDTDHNKGVKSGPAAYAYGFGVDGTTIGATRPDLSTTNVGNNTLSTILIADDLWVQADTSSFNNAKISSFSLSGMRFLVTNENSSDITVQAHVRIYDENPATGFAKKLIGTYDLGDVTLNGKGSNFASVTQVSVPSSALASAPVKIAGSEFTRLSAGKYEKRLWAALFFTADATTTTTTELGNVGAIVFDKDTAVNADKLDSRGTFFDVGRSNDQLDGDDITSRQNGPAANYAYTQDFDQLLFTSLFQTYSLDNAGKPGPEANFAWLMNGAVAVVPEPGTAPLVILGLLPIAAIVRRRRR